MKKRTHFLWTRMTAMLLALVCVLGLFPATAFAASDTIKLERFGMSGVSYESAALGRWHEGRRDGAVPDRPDLGK